MQNTGTTSTEILDCHTEEIKIALLDHLINLDFMLVNTNTNFLLVKYGVKTGGFKELIL